MAAVATLPQTKQLASKPTRAMTHPLRDTKGNTTRRRAKRGEPFDPEELSRRLTAHLADQKIRGEKRRESRAAKAAAAENIYHHVPKDAASAFERTTTQDVLRQVHKLAQPIVKAHMTELSEEHPSRGHVTSLKKTQARDHAMIERELQRNRNDFQLSNNMQEVFEINVARDLYTAPKRTFHTETSHLRSLRALNAARPVSTGDIFLDDEEAQVVAKAKAKQALELRNINDWEQRDDEVENRENKRDWSSPFLRKKDSSWIMKVKRQKSVGVNNKEDSVAVADIGVSGSPPDSKSGKGNFLARFKRHPS